MTEIDDLCNKASEIQLADDRQYYNRFCIEDADAQDNTSKEPLFNKGTGAGGANTTHNG